MIQGKLLAMGESGLEPSLFKRRGKRSLGNRNYEILGGQMIKKKTRRLPVDQTESISTYRASLQKSEKYNSNFKFYYDRKLKAIILRTEDLAMKRRFVSLSAIETMVLRTVQEELSGFTKNITTSDLREKIYLRYCDLETIRNILRSLVKKRILESEEITIKDEVIEVFKTK